MFHTITRHLTRAAALAAAALALGAGPAAAQVTTIGDGPAQGAQTICPGGAAVPADFFTLQASQTGDYVTKVKVQLNPSGAYAGIAAVEIRNAAGTLPAYGSAVPGADNFDVPLVTSINVTTSPVQYSIWVTPKGFGQVPTSLSSAALTAKVDLVFNLFSRTGADTSASALRFDSAPPADVGWTALVATTVPGAQITVGFAGPSDTNGILVLRDTKPVTDKPSAPGALNAYGAENTVFAGGTASIRWARAALTGQFTDTGLTAGTGYYYKAFVRDACGNWSAGEQIGPVYVGGSSEGDATPNSRKPMVGLVNPIAGGVVSVGPSNTGFKVQARIFSPKNATGGTQNILSASLAVLRPDGTAAIPTRTMVQNTLYGSATDSGIFEASPVITTLAAGSYTLRVTATNASGSASSAAVPITVGPGGDGNLLRRDNSSQLCSDCHALPTHSSESTSNQYGAWYAGCRSCHQPHGTTNASLLATEITPPGVAAQLPPTKTYFSTTTGYDPTANGTGNVAAATFANGDRTGPCQVCHTRTDFYRRSGFGGDGGPTSISGGSNHYTTTCTGCHKHTAGFVGAGCTGCHGKLPTDPARTSPTGLALDALVDAAPPRDHNGVTAATAMTVGVHLSHVTASHSLRAPLSCTECHPTPGSSGHDTQPLSLTMINADCNFSRGATPAPWTCPTGPTFSGPTTGTCSNTYCHGNFFNGNTQAPVWNVAGPSATCGSCHGIPPTGSPHPQGVTDCTTCHGAGYLTSGITAPAINTHMDGQLQVSGCTSCHGDSTNTRTTAWKDPTLTDAVTAAKYTDSDVQAMPPVNAHSPQTSATSTRGVGAHVTHVNKPGPGGAVPPLSIPLVCGDCHGTYPPPANHSSNPAAPVNIGGASTQITTWNGTNVTCATWCHGSAGTSNAAMMGPTPVWTTVNNSYKQCNSCHGYPPTTADKGHPNNQICANCHGTGYDTTANAQVVNYRTHVNGTTSFVASFGAPAIANTGCARCHGVLTGGIAQTDLRVAPGYIGTSAVAGYDTHGSNATTAVTVGAHDAHVNPTRAGNANISSTVACATCHGTLPSASNHANGAVDLNWGQLATSAMGTSYSPQGTSFTAAWAATPTCVVYCHSNASPLGGTRSTTASPAWTNTTNVTCTSCHAFVADSTLIPASTNLSHGHYKHISNAAGAYNFSCAECHFSVATTTSYSSNPAGAAIVAGGQAQHVNGTKSVLFNTATNPGTTSNNYQAATYTCTSTYCHSDGQNAAAPGANTSIAWNNAAGTTCTSCHQGPATLNTNAHAKHVNNAGTLASDGNYHCGDCHANTVPVGQDAVLISTGVSYHVNRQKDVNIPPRGGQASVQPTAGNCSNVYCHSSGQRTAARTASPVVWTATAWTNVCAGCHGRTTNTNGAPDYNGGAGGAGTANANSHAAHVSPTNGARDCYSCHANVTANGTSILPGGHHTDGNIDIQFSTTIAGVSASYVTTVIGGNTYAGTCSNVACHGGTGSKVTWGGPPQRCRDCHMGASGPTNSDVNDYVYQNGTISKIDPDDWGTFGHGAISNWVESANTASNFDRNGQDGCRYCHDTAANGGASHGDGNNPFRLKNVSGTYGKLGVCLACHDPAAAAWSPSGLVTLMPVTRISAVHYGASHATGNEGGQYCWDCHDPHGDYNYTAGQRLAYMFQEQPVMNHTATTGATDWGIPRSSADLAPTPDFRKNRSTGGVATAWDWTDYVSSTAVTQSGVTTYRGVCQVCHTSTAHFVQATYNAANDDAHTSYQACPTCHTHQQPPTTAFTPAGGGDCTGCHNSTKAITHGPLANTGSRRAAAAEFNNTWSHKRSGGKAATKWDCIVCHMEGDPATGGTSSAHMNGYVDLRDPDTGTTIENVYWSNASGAAGSYVTTTVTANRYASGMFARFQRNLSSSTIEPFAAAIMINQCLKCHDSNGARAFNAGGALQPVATQNAGYSATKPFGATIDPTNTASYQGGTGFTACATGTNGCVVNIDASFATTNSSYHPVKGKLNNSYATATRFNAPWNNITKTAGSTTAYGNLITCWDCHGANGASGVQTGTVTAHGGAATLRGAVWANPASLCTICHIANVGGTTQGSHGTGSAFNSSTNGSMQTYINTQCHICHASAPTKPTRPVQAQDAHGSNSMWRAISGPTGKWSVDPRPVAFIRTTVVFNNHQPASVGGTTSWGGVTGARCSTPTTKYTSCNNGMGTYTPGGTY